MSDLPQMKRPWSVVGAGFNDEGVYFTFDDNVIDRRDVNLMQAAPELLDALQTVKQEVGNFLMHQAPELLSEIDAAISKALGQ